MSAQPKLISTEPLISSSRPSGLDGAESSCTSNHTGDEVVVPTSTGDSLIRNSQSRGDDGAGYPSTSSHTEDEVVAPPSTEDILNNAMSSSYAFPFWENKHDDKNELTPTAVTNDYQPSAMLYIQRSGQCKDYWDAASHIIPEGKEQHFATLHVPAGALLLVDQLVHLPHP